jgi:hypothetical protein
LRGINVNDSYQAATKKTTRTLPVFVLPVIGG